MKKELKKYGVLLLAVLLAAGAALVSCNDIDALLDDGTAARASTGQKFTSNTTGNHDGYDYELWKDSGNVSMTLQNGGNFDCEWSNIGNVLFRKGKKFNSTQTHSQVGNITIDYSATVNSSGNTYLCVYGWTKSPLIEYYIVESWGSYRPTGTSKGTASIGGSTYDLYETTRTNQPSIEGTKTFKQFWAVRQSKRTSGTINVSDIFKAWENKGMTLGKMYEVALTVEGYQSSGSAKINSHYLKIGSSSSGNTGNNTTNNNNNNNTNTGNTGGTASGSATRVEAESMTKGGQYTGNCSSPFSGVTLYANNDKVSYSQYFSNNKHTFKLRGASSNNNKAQVQLKIGGTSYGTFEFTGTSAAEKSITVTHNKGGGNATVELICINDNNTWDVSIDWLEITASN
jgi:endo-1,4-beta-xylanase